MANFAEQTDLELNDGEAAVDLSNAPDQFLELATEQPVVEELPAKYRGKSVEDIAKMHRELEQLMGRQAQEVGELRKLTDGYLKQQLAPQVVETAPKEELNFFEDPEKAVTNLVASHPDVVAAKQARMDMQKRETITMLKEQHPDFEQVAQSPDFQEWVLGSNVRKRMFAEANNFDYETAAELLSNFKATRPKADTQAELEKVIAEKRTRDEMAAAQTASRKNATVASGGAGETSKKVYRGNDLIRLKMTDPQRYDSLQDEIYAAYAEGRVR